MVLTVMMVLLLGGLLLLLQRGRRKWGWIEDLVVDG